MSRVILSATALLAAVCLLAGSTAAARQVSARMPAVAGAYYPDDPGKLLQSVRGYFDAADAPDTGGAMVGCIASPAPYGFAGPVTAHAFKNLKPGQYDRVIILTPSHSAKLENCSIPAVEVFITPLGPVPLDVEAVEQLLFSPLFSARSLMYKKMPQREQIHEYEYGVEALLPYLQERLLEFKLVPVVVGELTDAGGNYNPRAAESIAKALRKIMTERTLVVASSSFTHFGNDFSNRPFNDNIIANIEKLDREAFEPILAMDAAGFERYLEKTKNVIDGCRCISVLLRMVPKHTQSRILAYDLLAAKTGDLDRSVSYAAFTFHDPARPPLDARPDRVRPLPVLGKPESGAETPPPTQQENIPPAAPQTGAAAPVPAPTTAPQPAEIQVPAAGGESAPASGVREPTPPEQPVKRKFNIIRHAPGEGAGGAKP